MKRSAIVFALFALPSAVLFAQIPGGQNTIGGGPGGGGIAKTPAEAAKAYIQTIDASVALTDEQVQQINDIFADRAKQLADFDTQNADKLKAASEALSKAYNAANDQATRAKAQQDYQDVVAPKNEIMKKSSERLDKVLTPAQKAKAADARLTTMIKWMAKPAELTDNQMKAVKAAATGDNPFENFRAFKEALDAVLTPAQKAAINKSHAMAAMNSRFFRANLTADQLKQIDAACDQIVKDASLDQNAVTDALTEKTTALLTADQKKAMETTSQRGEMRKTPGSDPK